MFTSRLPLLALLVLALLPTPARAHSIADEFSFGTTQPTPGNPTTGYVGDMLRGGLDLSDALSFRLALGLTYDEPSKRVGAHFKDSGGSIYSTALGLDWELNDHFDIDGELDYSPNSVQLYDASIEVPVVATHTTTETDAQLRAANGSKGAMLSFGYNSAGDSDFETSVDVGASYTAFDTVQNVTRVEQAGKVVGPAVLNNECQRALTTAAPNETQAQLAQAKATCRSLQLALQGGGKVLKQLQLRGALTATVFTDTDVTVSGSYYLYDQDPTQFGYFGKILQGRNRTGFGNGTPIAPTVYSVRPEVTHRFGGFMVDLWYSYNLYYGDQGHGHWFGVKLQYKLTKGLKAWVSGTLQDDLQPQETTGAVSSSSSGLTPSISTSATVGLKYSW